MAQAAAAAAHENFKWELRAEKFTIHNRKSVMYILHEEVGTPLEPQASAFISQRYQVLVR